MEDTIQSHSFNSLDTNPYQYGSQEWKDKGISAGEEQEPDPLTREEESSVKEVTFVLNGKQERFVVAQEVEAVVDQFPDEDLEDFST